MNLFNECSILIYNILNCFIMYTVSQWAAILFVGNANMQLHHMTCNNYLIPSYSFLCTDISKIHFSFFFTLKDFCRTHCSNITDIFFVMLYMYLAIVILIYKLIYSVCWQHVLMNLRCREYLTSSLFHCVLMVFLSFTLCFSIAIPCIFTSK